MDTDQRDLRCDCGTTFLLYDAPPATAEVVCRLIAVDDPEPEPEPDG